MLRRRIFISYWNRFQIYMIQIIFSRRWYAQISYVIRINPQYVVVLYGNLIKLKNSLRKITRADCAEYADPAEMTRYRRRLLSGLNRAESADPAKMTIFFSFQICRWLDQFFFTRFQFLLSKNQMIDYVFISIIVRLIF